MSMARQLSAALSARAHITLAQLALRMSVISSDSTIIVDLEPGVWCVIGLLFPLDVFYETEVFEVVPVKVVWYLGSHQRIFICLFYRSVRAG